MYNPFIESTKDEYDDIALITESLSGNSDALEKLLLPRQAWIYNVALKMVMGPDDEYDVTPGILIKIITRLSSYKPRIAQFRT